SCSAILNEDRCVFSSIPSVSRFFLFSPLYTSCLVKREDTGHTDLEHLSYPSSSQKIHRGSLMGLGLWQERCLSVRMHYGKETIRRFLPVHRRLVDLITEGEGTLPGYLISNEPFDTTTYYYYYTLAVYIATIVTTAIREYLIKKIMSLRLGNPERVQVMSGGNTWQWRITWPHE